MGFADISTGQLVIVTFIVLLLFGSKRLRKQVASLIPLHSLKRRSQLTF